MAEQHLSAVGQGRPRAQIPEVLSALFGADSSERAAQATPARFVRLSMPGDAMSPTIESGDELVVDLHDCRIHSGGGVYVLEFDSRPVVRRMLLTCDGAWQVTTDSALYRDAEVPVGSVKVLGRVAAVFRMRAL